MITLFDYQKIALDLIVNAFKTRAMALAVMATGLGKTIVAAFWANRELKKKRKGLFLCHENGILDQAMVEFRKVIDDRYSLKPFYGDKKDWRADEADMVFASFQTYAIWKDAFLEHGFDFIIVDESHHGQALSKKSSSISNPRNFSASRPPLTGWI
jgi:superfamily II DNA or RNA helicase